jgi:hypothetical protein
MRIFWGGFGGGHVRLNYTERRFIPQ